MTPEDKQLYQALGQRIAAGRKALGLTQTQVAEQLGISQQTFAHYEVGRLRIAVSTLVPLSEILNSSIDELVYGEVAAKGHNERGPASKLQQQVEQGTPTALDQTAVYDGDAGYGDSTGCPLISEPMR